LGALLQAEEGYRQAPINLVEECESFAVDTDLKGYVGTPTTIAAHAPPDIPPDPPAVSWGDEGEAADPGVTVFMGDHQVDCHPVQTQDPLIILFDTTEVVCKAGEQFLFSVDPQGRY
jgi:hypothetical protein